MQTRRLQKENRLPEQKTPENEQAGVDFRRRRTLHEKS